MTIKAVLVGVLAIGLAATPALAKKAKAPPAPPCVKDKVLVALETRMLQTELVVGALSCQMTPRYNDFVKAYQPDLMAAHKTLLRFFGRESKMEDYKSKTANEVSQRSLANINEFCAYSTSLYDKLLGSEKVQLTSFVQSEPSAARHGFDVCGQPASMVTAAATPGASSAAAPAAMTAAAPAGAAVPMPRFKPEVAATHKGKGKKVDPNAAYVPPAAPATTP
jgi:hypothetical protein